MTQPNCGPSGRTTTGGHQRAYAKQGRWERSYRPRTSSSDPRANRPLVLLMGTLGLTVFNALMYVAAHHTTAVNLTILQGSMPVLVLVGALLFYGTRIHGWQIFGMAVTLFGTLLVATRADLATLTSFSFNIGDLWMLAACGLYAGY